MFFYGFLIKVETRELVNFVADDVTSKITFKEIKRRELSS